MAWGGLNPALTAWRNGINQRFPRRGTRSDGGYADSAHASSSEHQADADGTVDAFDCDVNFLASNVETGTSTERRIAAALKADFEDDPRSQLWISYRKISNRDIGPWRVRDYGGASPHDHHIHFQTRQSRERDGSAWAMPRTDALLRELEGDMPITPAEFTKIEQIVERRVADVAKQVFSYPVKLPDGRELDFYTVFRWLPAADLDTRNQVLAALGTLAGKDFTDEGAIVAGVLAGLDPAAIAAAIPADMARQVADELAARLSA